MAKGGMVEPKDENTAQHQNIRGLVCHGKAFELYLKGRRELLEDLSTGVTQTDFGVRITLQFSTDCLCSKFTHTASSSKICVVSFAAWHNVKLYQ